MSRPALTGPVTKKQEEARAVWKTLGGEDSERSQFSADNLLSDAQSEQTLLRKDKGSDKVRDNFLNKGTPLSAVGWGASIKLKA